MHLKIITAMAAILILAACTTASDLSTSEGDGGKTQKSSDSVELAPITGKNTPDIASGSQADLVANVGDRVLFEYDSSDLTSESRKVLERQAAWLKRYADVTVVIQGHCDERGTREYNLALGERRANAVSNFLVALGVSTSRIRTISYGKERPVALGSNETAWSQNRRGVTVVY